MNVRGELLKKLIVFLKDNKDKLKGLTMEERIALFNKNKNEQPK